MIANGHFHVGVRDGKVVLATELETGEDIPELAVPPRAAIKLAHALLKAAEKAGLSYTN